MPVADVQTAFSTTDSTDTATLPGVGAVPLNVAQICEWTWMCAPSPIGPNDPERPEPVHRGDILTLSHDGTTVEVLGVRQIFAAARWEQVAYVNL